MTSPFKGRFRLTSPRGTRVLYGKCEYHKGIDLVGVDDTTVYAVADGVISAVPFEADGFGRYVRQVLDDGRRIYYAHLTEGSVSVAPGERVRKGDALGRMGSTGYCFGTHTHLELRGSGTGSDSLDICEYTGIPNEAGTYEYEEAVEMRFTDVGESHWAYEAIKKLAELGIVDGDGDGCFRPDEPISRAEAAKVVVRLIEKTE